MTTFQRCALALLLVLSGFFAGIMFNNAVGMFPALARMPVPAYVQFWQSMDFFMGQRMPLFEPILIVSFVLALAALWSRRHSALFAIVVLCMLANLGEIAFTVAIQRPLNREVQSLDINRPADLARAVQTRELTIEHFTLRQYLAMGTFASLVFAMFLSLPFSPLRDTMPRA